MSAEANPDVRLDEGREFAADEFAALLDVFYQFTTRAWTLARVKDLSFLIAFDELLSAASGR